MKSPRATLAIIILLVAVVAALASLEFARVSRMFYAQIVESESRGVRDRLSAHLVPALTSLSLTSRLLGQSQTRGLAPDSPEMLVLSTLTNEASVDAATLLDQRGVVALAARLPQGFAVYVRPGQEEPQGKRLHLDKDMRPAGRADISDATLASMAAEVERASRREPRSWPAWTGVHPLPGAGRSAVSVAAPAGPDGDASQEFCFSFTVERLREALSGEQHLQDVRPLLFTPEGLLLDLDRNGHDPVPGPLFVPRQQVEDKARAGAMNAWLAQDKPGGEAFSFQAGGATWWASLQPVSDAAYSASAGLAVSQEALLSLILADNRAPLLLGGGVILVLVLLVLLGVQLRRRGRAAPGPFFDTEADVLKLLAEGESERLEFKSSLRLNLASGKFGKEIELACMKTLAAYMNTDGGILAVGVDDQGQVLGLQPDGFENDDHLLRHFCALFAQHIGTEFMRLVRFALRSVGDAQVLLIECSPSEEPVFLKGTKEEEFYVRAGPSSRRLSISEFHRRVLRKEGPR
ncbi:helix-turn-helix domain-containing protein [Fundidesulfovibrio soli]|uniref:AlbA family DNA-binding domain-containing protein n=1 Tax=Fundidesulfovibrio soli TaxID=2922716 RepID=UPI001FB009D4